MKETIAKVEGMRCGNFFYVEVFTYQIANVRFAHAASHSLYFCNGFFHIYVPPFYLIWRIRRVNLADSSWQTSLYTLIIYPKNGIVKLRKANLANLVYRREFFSFCKKVCATKLLDYFLSIMYIVVVLKNRISRGRNV